MHPHWPLARMFQPISFKMAEFRGLALDSANQVAYLFRIRSQICEQAIREFAIC